MPSGVKIKREFISSFTGLRFVETNFCYDFVFRSAKTILWIKTRTLAIF